MAMRLELPKSSTLFASCLPTLMVEPQQAPFLQDKEKIVWVN